MKYIKIGHITKPFGLKGDLKVYSYTDFIDERFKANNEVYIYHNNEYIPMIIDKFQIHKGMINVKFKDIDNINQVEKYSDCPIYFDFAKLHKLDEGQYYKFELIGLKAYDTNNNFLGDVIDIEFLPAHNNLRIGNKDHTFLVPNIPQFVDTIDLDNKIIKIKMIEGLK